jgi:hypothetical protein
MKSLNLGAAGDSADEWGAPGAQAPEQQEVETGTWRAFSPGSADGAAPPSAPKAPPAAGRSRSAAKGALNQDQLSGAPRQASNSNGGDKSEKVGHAFESLDKLLQEAYKDIKANIVPDADKIEKARTALLDALSSSSFAAQLPLLQKFLRATLVQLIAASSGAQQVTAQLKEVGRLHEESWKQVQTECAAILNQKKRPFWELSI